MGLRYKQSSNTSQRWVGQVIELAYSCSHNENSIVVIVVGSCPTGVC